MDALRRERGLLRLDGAPRRHRRPVPLAGRLPRPAGGRDRERHGTHRGHEPRVRRCARARRRAVGGSFRRAAEPGPLWRSRVVPACPRYGDSPRAAVRHHRLRRRAPVHPRSEADGRCSICGAAARRSLPGLALRQGGHGAVSGRPVSAPERRPPRSSRRARSTRALRRCPPHRLHATLPGAAVAAAGLPPERARSLLPREAPPGHLRPAEPDSRPLPLPRRGGAAAHGQRIRRRPLPSPSPLQLERRRGKAGVVNTLARPLNPRRTLELPSMYRLLAALTRPRQASIVAREYVRARAGDRVERGTTTALVDETAAYQTSPPSASGLVPTDGRAPTGGAAAPSADGDPTDQMRSGSARHGVTFPSRSATSVQCRGTSKSSRERLTIRSMPLYQGSVAPPVTTRTPGGAPLRNFTLRSLESGGTPRGIQAR